MAYIVSIARKTAKLPYLPLVLDLPQGRGQVVLQDFQEEDFEEVYVLMRDIVEEGQTYPQDTMDKDHFRSYYLSDRVFVLKDLATGALIGSFYVKPNYPGRSSHICNGGFAVNPVHRGKGALQVMSKAYIRIGRDLGYKGSFFNLVYASNTAALHVYTKLGFRKTGLVPKAGDLKGLGMVDAVQFYYDLTTLDQAGLPPGGWP